MKVFLSGIDGSGKTTVKNILTKQGYDCDDRYPEIDQLTFEIDYSKFPEKLKEENIIVLTADQETLKQRINSRDKKDIYETDKSLFYFDRRFREIACYYNIPVVDTTHLKPEETCEKIVNLLNQKHYRYPFKDVTPEHLHYNPEYKLVVEGESKQVFKHKDQSDICYIILKNTIYSHSMQSTGTIENLGSIRGEGSRYFLEMMNRNKIKHSYICVNNHGVICSKWVENINPLEVVVKEYCEGTDKHSYYKYRQNFADSDGKYTHGPYVRFDWRNPNHLNEDGVDIREALPDYYKKEEEMGKLPFFEKYLTKPMGDKTISEHILKEIIDTEQAKEEALKFYYTIKFHFQKAGLIIKDICFMLSGDTFWSEVNQDCMRIVPADKNAETLDKDIWRSGGSSRKEKLISKWKTFNNLMKQHFEKFPYKKTGMVKYWEYDYQITMKENFDKIKNITHNEIYYKLLRPGKRKFIVKYKNVPEKVLFPDILVDYNENDLQLYKSCYPHVMCKNIQECKKSIENSARRIWIDHDTDLLPNKRKIVTHPMPEKDLAVLNNEKLSTIMLNCYNNKVISTCEDIEQVEECWKLGAVALVNENLAYQIWKLTFKVPDPTLIIQENSGKIKETIKMENFDEFNVSNFSKLLLDKEGKSFILMKEKHNYKGFSNQSVLKSGFEVLQKHNISSQTAMLNLIQGVWKIEESPSEFMKNLLVYLSSNNISITDIKNDLNADRWNIFQEKNKKERETLLIAITSSKYQEKTNNFLRQNLGVELEAKKSKRSLKLHHKIINKGECLYKKHFTKPIKFISCRPKDMPWLMAFGRIDGAVTYNTVMDNYPKVYKTSNLVEDNDLKLCLVKKKGKEVPIKPKIAAEHPRIIKQFIDSCETDTMFGSSESYLVNSDEYDLCDAIVETGNTIKENNLEIYKTLDYPVKVGLFLN